MKGDVWTDNLVPEAVGLPVQAAAVHMSETVNFKGDCLYPQPGQLNWMVLKV